jgi:phosphatidylglycerol:prolipoprotein diacylglycerol transferase
MHPTLLHIGFLTIPTFGLLAAIGLMLALALSLRTAVAAGLNPDRLWSAGLFAVIAAFVLSRLLLVATNLHTFFSYPILLLMVPSLTPLGLLLTAVATAIYIRLHQLPFLSTLDAWAPCATLAWAFFALGHFAEGSDPGLPSTLPWAMPNAPGSPFREHPIALYVAVTAAIITLVLLRHLRRPHAIGSTAALALALAGLAQFLITFLRQPEFEDNAFGTLLDPIQWVALGMIVIAALLWQQPRRVVAHAV